MARGNITKRAVDIFTAGSSTDFLWDQDVKGFGLKVTPTGNKTYVFQYRLGGREAKVRRYGIGSHGQWTPDAARKEAKRLGQLVDQGIDPGAEAKTRRTEAVELAFSTYAEKFIATYLQSHWRGGFELASGMLRREAMPFFKNKPLMNITRADISNLMDKLADRPATRRNTFAILRRLFRWAVNRGDISLSPLNDMEAPPSPASRDRVLNDDELALVWLACYGTGYPFGPLVQLLILSGQRREEVAGLTWAELDRVTETWTLPAARSKNGLVHDVPLSSAVVALLDEIASELKLSTPVRRWPRGGFVFTSTGDKHVTGYSKAKIRLDSFIVKTTKRFDKASPLRFDDNISAWRFHDLRRTFATGLQRLGVRFEVTEAILNHMSGSRSGVAGVYQRHNWAEEKREALEAWGRHVIEQAEQLSAHMRA